jgi:hypothetical protein
MSGRPGATVTEAPGSHAIYAQLEQKLLGEDGAIPVVPIYWYTYPNLEKLSIKDSFTVNLLSQIDLTKVVVREQ